MHSSFADKFTFKIPLHPKNLAQLIHPFQGYMCFFPKGSSAHQLSFDQLIQAYENMIVSSVERGAGKHLHADELSALTFWLMLDSEKKGSVDFEQFKGLMSAFRFANLTDLDSFKTQFKTVLKS